MRFCQLYEADNIEMPDIWPLLNRGKGDQYSQMIHMIHGAGIFTYIWIFRVSVGKYGKYTIHGASGIG